MCAKYFPNSHPLVTVYKAKDSPLWRRLTNIKDEAKEAIRWVPGIKEGNLSFWFDHWLGDEPLATSIGHEGVISLQVKEMLVNGEWSVPYFFFFRGCSSLLGA